MLRRCFAILALLSAPATAAFAQNAANPVGAKDVVVDGVKPVPKNAPTKPTEDYANALGRTSVREKSEMFVRCAKELDLDLVGAAIDSPMNTSAEKYALGRVLTSHYACYPGADATFSADPNTLGDCNLTRISATFYDCRAPYDRGAILETAMRRYAPELSLSEKDTNSPLVKARFNAREGPLNRFRLGPDFQYFQVAVCMVRLQPRLSVALFHTEAGSRAASDIEATMLLKARRCVGDARKVKYDTSELRLYLMDALYRWVVAARGVKTLIER